MGNEIEIAEITKIRQDNPTTKTFFLKHRMDAKPGQFVMVWLPGVDEKPFGVSYAGEELGITVCKVGPATEKMFALKKGDRLGVRGPYGTHFNLKGKRIILVGGGFGSAPLRLLAEDAKRKGIAVDFVQGARSKERLILESELKKVASVHLCTDDGSFGPKGRVTDVLETLLEKNSYDAVYACGPELMMRTVGELCESKGIHCEISVERYMKCGFGVCGQCDCGGFLTCIEGPCVPYKKLRDNAEFGKTRREPNGQKKSFV
ncbi:dihydroorotate dehydrogenase electron transfer subunit [Candidatus Micrarchaeota archaeon]|nr:dihydroorotate dehydrogenase electron transfer subunit [Candidatus Micrarchaeota archaeon]